MYYYTKDVDIIENRKEICEDVRGHLPWINSNDEEILNIVKSICMSNSQMNNYSFYLSEVLIKIIKYEMQTSNISLNIEYVTD